MESEDFLSQLKTTSIDNFSADILSGAEAALSDIENRLRLNFFCLSLRILFEHTLDILAPSSDVEKSPWYITDSNKPTRRQRVSFAIHGGFKEDFITKVLAVDTEELYNNLLTTIDELSKHVHCRENTVILDQDKQNILAHSATRAMANFFDTIHKCRSAITEPIIEHLDEATVDAIASDSLLDIDELASHFSLEEIHINDVQVAKIDAHTITYRSTGTVYTTLQWGSNSDLRRGDGAELQQSFPFFCEFGVPLDEPWDLSVAETSCYVDTSSWRDAMHPDAI